MGEGGVQPNNEQIVPVVKVERRAKEALTRKKTRYSWGTKRAKGGFHSVLSENAGKRLIVIKGRTKKGGKCETGKKETEKARSETKML